MLILVYAIVAPGSGTFRCGLLHSVGRRGGAGDLADQEGKLAVWADKSLRTSHGASNILVRNIGLIKL